MQASSFGYSARLQSRSAPEPWVRAAGLIFSLGLLMGLAFWWNGLIDPHEAPKQMIFALVMFGVLPMTIIAANRGIFHRPFAWITTLSMSLVLFSGLISWVLAPDRWLAFFGTSGSISSSFFTLLIALAAASISGTLAVLDWKPSATLVYGGLSGTILITLIQRLGWIDISSGGAAARVFSPAGNEGALAWFVVAVGVYAIAQELLVTTDSIYEIWIRRLFLFISVGWLGCLDVTQIWIALFLGLAILCGVAFFSKGTRVTRSALGWVVGGLVISVAGMLIHVPQPANWPNLVALSWSESWSVVRTAWEQKGFWFGMGQGQWTVVFESVRPLSLNLGSLYNIRFDTGGAYWWTLLLQQGIFGAIAWLVFLLFSGLKTIMRVREESERIPLALAVWTGAIATFFVQPHGWSLIILFVAFGYLLADRHEASRIIRLSWSAILGVFSAMILIALPNGFQRLRADRLLVKAQDAKTTEARRELAHQAKKLVPWLSDGAFIATQMDSALFAERLQRGIQDSNAFQHDLATAIERSKEATKRWPHDPGLWLAQGALYASISPVTKGADQFAIQAYQEGIKYAPHHPGFALGIAQVFVLRATDLAKQAPATDDLRGDALAKARLEQLRLAAEWFKRALDQKPDDLSAQYAYASTLARSGNAALAAPLFEALWRRDPTRSDLALEYATVLAAIGKIPEAITVAEKIGSQDRVYLDSRRLLAIWYESEKRYAEAVSALRALPLTEQQTAAFRQRLNRLQSQSKSSTGSR